MPRPIAAASRRESSVSDRRESSLSERRESRSAFFRDDPLLPASRLTTREARRFVGRRRPQSGVETEPSVVDLPTQSPQPQPQPQPQLSPQTYSFIDSDNNGDITSGDAFQSTDAQWDVITGFISGQSTVEVGADYIPAGNVYTPWAPGYYDETATYLNNPVRFVSQVASFGYTTYQNNNQINYFIAARGDWGGQVDPDEFVLNASGADTIIWWQDLNDFQTKAWVLTGLTNLDVVTDVT